MTGRYRLSPEKRAERAERMRRLNQDPDFAAKRDARAKVMMREMNADPAQRTKALDASIAERRTTEGRARSRRIHKAVWSDPALRERQRRITVEHLAADPGARAQLENARRLAVIARGGLFHCPPELRDVYVKLRNALGIDAARAAIRRMIEQSTLAGVDFTAAGGEV